MNIERLSRISLTTQTLIQADFHRGNHHFWAIKDKNTELNKSQELHVLLVIRKYCQTKNCSYSLWRSCSYLHKQNRFHGSS